MWIVHVPKICQTRSLAGDRRCQWVFRAYITDNLDAFGIGFDEYAYHLCWKH